MKSKISFFNAGLIKQDFKQHGWIGLVYLIGLLFSLPLTLMMLASSEMNHYRIPENFFRVGMEIQIIFILTVPIAAGIFIFRYMQVKDSSDMIHSLPIGRGQLYLNHIVSGLLMLLIPVWVTGAVTGVVSYFHPFSEHLAMSDLMVWIGITSLMTLFFFIFSVFVGMNTGQSVAQGIITYILLLLPMALIVLISFHLKQFLYGFSDTFISSGIEKWSPIASFIDVAYRPFSITEILIYGLLIIVFGTSGYFLYKLRHVESATDPISFTIFKPIFKYGVTFCAMILAGAYFSEAQNLEGLGWTYFGYIVGAIGGYIIADMVLNKTWRVFGIKMIRGLIGFSLVMVILLIGIQTDVIGYETKLPNVNKVEGVYFGNGPYELRDRLLNNDPVFHEDQTFIQDVHSLHQKITITKPKRQNDYYMDTLIRSVFIAYKMENGRMMVRQYTIPTKDFSQELAPIIESEIYKQERFSLKNLEKPIDKITISPSEYVTQKQIIITNPTEILEVTEALKQDILSLTYEEMSDSRRSVSNIEFLFSDDNRAYFEATMFFDQLEGWLREKGYLDKTRVLPEDISSMQVAKVQAEDTERGYHPEEVFFKSPVNIKAEFIEIKDKIEIEEALNNYSGYGIATYFVKFRTHQGHEFYGTFREGNIPTFIPQYFSE